MSVDDVPAVPTEGTIRLGQFLKLANLVDSGAEARELIADGEVTVDGEVETRRGRQLAKGMLVQVDLPTGRVAARVG